MQDTGAYSRAVNRSRRAMLGGLLGLAGGLFLPVPGWCKSVGSVSGHALDAALKGQNLLAGGDAPGAVAALERAVALDPKMDFAWGLLGRAALATDDRVRALSAFSAAVGLRPSDSYSRMMIDYILQLPPEQSIAEPISTDQDSTVAMEGSQPSTPDPLRAKAERERREGGARQEAAHATGNHGYRIRRVVLDPGHGGVDPGAVGPSGLREKDVVLDLARRTAVQLSRDASGLKVFLTRSTDRYISLSGRTALANRFGADLFVSLHVNAAERRAAAGLETYWCSESASSKEAARVAQFENSVRSFDAGADAPALLGVEDFLFRYERSRYWNAGGVAAQQLRSTLLQGLERAGRSMADRGAHTADFFVLRKARMPAVLLETGFITNPDEERFLGSESGRGQVAQGLAHAIVALSREGV